MPVTWNTKLKAEIAARLADALTEFDGRVETAAKAELYPGHGKRSGMLQRAIFGTPAQIDGARIRGAIGVRGVPYARVIHARYQYIRRGFDKTRPSFRAIVRRRVAS